MDEKEIIINSHKYLISINKNGKGTAKHYDEKYKVWVNVNFSDDLDDSEKTIEKVKDILKKEYIGNLNDVLEKDILHTLNDQIYKEGLIPLEVHSKAKKKINDSK